MLTEQVRKREKKKLERAGWVKGFVEGVVWPKEGEMKRVLGVVKRCVGRAFFLFLLAFSNTRIRKIQSIKFA